MMKGLSMKSKSITNKLKNELALDVLPLDNNTGLCYDHQGVANYAKVKGKRISELSESEKRKFLYSAETPAPEQKEAENND